MTAARWIFLARIRVRCRLCLERTDPRRLREQVRLDEERERGERWWRERLCL